MSRNNYNTAAVQNPDGGILMATIASENPYVALNDEEITPVTAVPVDNNSNVSIAVANTNLVLIVPSSMAQRVIESQRYSCGIKFICILDFTLNFLYVIGGYWLAILFCLFSFYGYYSTYTHDRNMLCGYLLYQYAITLGKFCAVLFYCFMLNNDIASNFNNNYPNFQLPRDLPGAIGYSSILFFIQVYIAWYVRKYYYLLPSKKEINNIYLADREAMV